MVVRVERAISDPHVSLDMPDETVSWLNRSAFLHLRERSMPYIKTRDGVDIYVKD